MNDSIEAGLAVIVKSGNICLGQVRHLVNEMPEGHRCSHAAVGSRNPSLVARGLYFLALCHTAKKRFRSASSNGRPRRSVVIFCSMLVCSKAMNSKWPRKRVIILVVLALVLFGQDVMLNDSTVPSFPGFEEGSISEIPRRTHYPYHSLRYSRS
jgi:hypothetical protein